MKKTILALTALLFLTIQTLSAQQPAFPGAEGFAANATGGRGGKVVHVTNLNASGAGSLADAVSQPNRIVVFDVGGVIDITNASITIKSNITIAGQTAPGQGITIYGGRVIASGSKNVVIRYIRASTRRSARSPSTTVRTSSSTIAASRGDRGTTSISPMPTTSPGSIASSPKASSLSASAPSPTAPATGLSTTASGPTTKAATRR